MRSRYCAFALQNSAYLLATWDPSTRPASIDLDPELQWYQLQILCRTGGGLLDRSGTVEFVARYRSPGVSGEQHEDSHFVRADGRWLYSGPVDTRPSLQKPTPARRDLSPDPRDRP